MDILETLAYDAPQSSTSRGNTDRRKKAYTFRPDARRTDLSEGTNDRKYGAGHLAAADHRSATLETTVEVGGNSPRDDSKKAKPRQTSETHREPVERELDDPNKDPRIPTPLEENVRRHKSNMRRGPRPLELTTTSTWTDGEGTGNSAISRCDCTKRGGVPEDRPHTSEGQGRGRGRCASGADFFIAIHHARVADLYDMIKARLEGTMAAPETWSSQRTTGQLQYYPQFKSWCYVAGCPLRPPSSSYEDQQVMASIQGINAQRPT